MAEKKCVIVGASHAGLQLGLSLRQGGWTGRIVLISDEDESPYQRPPLSKGMLDGSKDRSSIALRPAAILERSELEFRNGVRVDQIDTGNKTLVLNGNGAEPFDHLALTTGARPRIPNIEGAALDGVHCLRNLADVDRIRQGIEAGRNAVIVGGGYIGLEAAAVLKKCEMNVTVIEAMPRVLQRVTAPVVSAFYQRIHEEEGVGLLTDMQVSRIGGENRVAFVETDRGEQLPADLVILAAGIVPNVELAQQAGLEVSNGIRVDSHARCSDTSIVAAGDCTCFYSGIYDREVRLESVQNASDQAGIAAATLNGELRPYDPTPWFWSEQYDVKLQIAGLSQGHDRIVIRGNPHEGRSFSAFYFLDDKLLAVDSVNRPAEFMLGKRMAGRRLALSPERLKDESLSIKEFMQ